MIPGLTYVKYFIDQQTHDDLLKQVDLHPWLTDLKRRTQHYGYKYDYTLRKIDDSLKIGDLPFWTNKIIDLFEKHNLIKIRPDQMIVNEYQPGQGIASHVDCVPCFTSTIISLSLGSTCTINFTNKLTKKELNLFVEPRSLLILKGEARYDWTHGIPARKTDRHHDLEVVRGRRVSLTFRKVIVTE